VELSFSAKLWIYSGENPWHFITLPKKIANEVSDGAHLRPRRGFGSIRVNVRLGSSNWRTSIFPDSTSGSYFLPIKKSIRVKEKLSEGDSLKIKLELLE
jgi:hypothetical protein